MNKGKMTPPVRLSLVTAIPGFGEIASFAVRAVIGAAKLSIQQAPPHLFVLSISVSV